MVRGGAALSAELDRRKAALATAQLDYRLWLWSKGSGHGGVVVVAVVSVGGGAALSAGLVASS